VKRRMSRPPLFVLLVVLLFDLVTPQPTQRLGQDSPTVPEAERLGCPPCPVVSLWFGIRLVFGPFDAQAQAPAITRTSAPRCALVTFDP
jgi:hypothetical protein